MRKKRKGRYPEEFLEKLKGVTAKRAKTVIDHILEHGSISTEELKDIYGYGHPPRAVRDVREQGIPIGTFGVIGKNGRKIAAYRLPHRQSKRENRKDEKFIPRNSKRASPNYRNRGVRYARRSMNRVICNWIIAFLLKSAVKRAPSCCSAVHVTARSPGLANTVPIRTVRKMSRHAHNAIGQALVVTHMSQHNHFGNCV